MAALPNSPQPASMRAFTPEQAAQITTALRRSDLSPWESSFLIDLQQRRRPLSDRQGEILARCARGKPNYAAINAAAMRRLPESRSPLRRHR